MLRRIFHAVVLATFALPVISISQAQNKEAPVLKKVLLGNGIRLHYAESGNGPPFIFVHGSISDYTYWLDQLGPFSEHYRTIIYSRRYNYPNRNTARPGYSAITDADDLAALITKLHLGKATIIGHSYGAYTALFLAVRHPELINAVVLAEAPAVPLLRYLPGDQTKVGRETFDDIQRRMVAPMKAAFS